ncbi:hypothetical protein SADUNF_Sadunf03G0143700 [Salix dunnii]|uniref:Uncharacterized protein n=1 Tax=Salix dunnii TaxID=1413687 RepID=A0A835N4X0_9ROSI|nr:hypothetical protein SADUNF_Sadunf03G0143700 [Salix dunnii]
MVLDNLITSPHLRSPSFRKQSPRDDLGSWSTLLQRNRFLLTALVLLASYAQSISTSVGHGKLKFF